MNALAIRITGRDESGTCQLTQKKRTEVFTGEFPIGTPSMTLCPDALLQEIRRTMIHQSPAPGDEGASSDKGTTTTDSQSTGRRKTSSAA